MFHPHIHCIVPGGGLSTDESHWISCRPGFFLPVRVLSRFFRSRFLRSVDQLYGRGEFVLEGKLRYLLDPSAWKSMFRKLRQTEWVVYSKAPFGGLRQFLKYLAGYTHRVAICNQRLLCFEHGRVTFRYKDYRLGGRPRTMTLQGVEFIRRFLLHILPKGFVRIRGYGFLANCCRQDKLALCRNLLGESHPDEPPDCVRCESSTSEATSWLCPVCGKAPMLLIETLPPAIPGLQERIHSP